MIEEPYVPIDDVAKHFTVSISTIRAWVRHGNIPPNTYIKIGNTYRFKISEVANALTNSKTEDAKGMEEVMDSISEDIAEEEQLEFNFDEDQ